MFKVLTGDFEGAWELISVNLWNIVTSFLAATWEVPYSGIYQGYAISYNIGYFLYLVWIELMRVAWVFFKVYLNWLFDIIGITLDLFYELMYWIANLMYWLPYYLIKFTILFI